MPPHKGGNSLILFIYVKYDYAGIINVVYFMQLPTVADLKMRSISVIDCSQLSR